MRARCLQSEKCVEINNSRTRKDVEWTRVETSRMKGFSPSST